MCQGTILRCWCNQFEAHTLFCVAGVINKSSPLLNPCSASLWRSTSHVLWWRCNQFEVLTLLYVAVEINNSSPLLNPCSASLWRSIIQVLFVSRYYPTLLVLPIWSSHLVLRWCGDPQVKSFAESLVCLAVGINLLNPWSASLWGSIIQVRFVSRYYPTLLV